MTQKQKSEEGISDT